MRCPAQPLPAVLFAIIVGQLSYLWHVAAAYQASNSISDYETYPTKLDLKAKRPKPLERSKVDILGAVLKQQVEELRQVPDRQVELVFLVDSSASVGAENFFNELKFVKKLLADFTVEYNATRVALVTFSSRNRVVKHVDHVSYPTEENHKCALLENQLPTITYQGGGTYTLGAMLQAQEVLARARPNATKAVFLVTDGYSNGGDPRPAAKVLRDDNVEIFTFGIQNGNVRELRDMASEPTDEHCYILDSFEEFEALARRALHEDIHIGSYLKQDQDACSGLCPEGQSCCDIAAECTCGTHTGHYACLCQQGFYGTGLQGDCHPCPAGTYRPYSSPGDVSSCLACPDINQVSLPGSTSIESCQCKTGFQKIGDSCIVLECPLLSPPEHGYFVNNECNRVFNAACGIRCDAGYKLRGSSIRLCAENGTWTGEDSVCDMKTCPPLNPPRHGTMSCTASDYVFETECHFSCDAGYSLVGSKKRTCLSISLWDGLPALCRPVSCSALKPLPNGDILPGKCMRGKSTYGEICNYTCKDGFQLSGPSQRMCVGFGTWSEEESLTTCIDIEPPGIKCPEDVVVDADENEANAMVTWNQPAITDNSEEPIVLSVVPAIVSPRRFYIGVASIIYTAEDRAKNTAECNFTVTVRDVQPPVVDRCISPPTVLSRVLPVEVSWEDPTFSDNSGRPLNTWSSHRNPSSFPLGQTDVLYEVRDDAGYNNTCVVTITVQEHACAFPNIPLNGHRNCTEADNGVFCSLSCSEGYGFALRPPPFYFCAYDGKWKPEESLPFPDCSPTFFSNSISKFGIVSVMSNGLSCEDNFRMEQLEKHLQRKISNRVSRVCRKNVICEVENMIAECENSRDEVEEETNLIFRRKRHTYDRPLQRVARGVPIPHQFAISRAMQRNFTRPPTYNSHASSHGSDISAPQFLLRKDVDTEDSEEELDFNQHVFHEGQNSRSKTERVQLENQPGLVPPLPEQDLHSEEVLQNKIELEFQLTGKLLEEADELIKEHSVLMDSIQTAMHSLEEAANNGELDISLGNNRLHVEYVRFNTEEPTFVCEAGSIVLNNKCVKCPVGTFFNVVSETCEGCRLGTYQFREGQLSCVVCPERTSTTTGQSKSLGECKAQCLPGSFSFNGLEPCETCTVGHYQPHYAQTTCLPCPTGAITHRRGVRHVSECKALCAPGTVSRIGLQPCFPCPDGYFQPHKGSKSCFKCPGSLPTGKQGATDVTECKGASQDVIKKPPPVSAELTINDCFSVPCLHGSTCQALDIGFLCICKPGYSGIYCETEIDECESQPCMNSGSCQDGINSYKCFCLPGYTGDHCEDDIDDCLNDPCYNGASCFDKINGYQCKCPPGFVGPLCQYNVDDCISSPCRNGGICQDLIAGYSCDCIPGFAGHNCETNIDDCADSPCKNNATCIDDIQRFQCQCPAGFSGNLCEEDINECQPQPCMNGATCLDGIASFKCLCPPAYVGDLCETELSSDFLLHFPYSGIVDFVQLDYLPRPLTQLTMCMWMLTDDKLNYGTPVSYAAEDGADNLLTLTDYSGFVFYINMEKVVTDVTANDGMWHHICVTWSSYDGSWAIYKDGTAEDRGFGLATATYIPADGCIVLGQEQDKRGSGFSAPESFIGTLTLLNIWDYVLSSEEIAAFSTRCDKYHGNVRSWPDFLSGIHGKVERQDSRFCTGCSDPVQPPNGDISVSGVKTQAVASYSCSPGYELRGVSTRRCLVCGNWSDTNPQCVRINCGFPGFMANGYINGRQYLYHDTIQYVCNPAYRLIGESSRTCQVDRKWSGSPPHCEEIQCAAPMALDNGRITTLQGKYLLGHRVGFVCEDGYRLYGAHSLTCNSDGQWNDSVPVCQPRSCESPPRVPHGIIVGPQQTNFDVGSVVLYRCDEGFEMKESGEIHCELKNRWAGDLPRCERVSCGTPFHVPHATYEGRDFLFGGMVTYKCDRGYEMRGTDYIVCQANKMWSDEPPECHPVSCGRLESPEHGGVDVKDFTYGSVVKYYCHTGYELKGVKSRKCRASGDWSGEAPTCVPVSCSQPESISNGRYMGSDWTVGNTVTYSCNTGYVLIGEAERVCLESGHWLHEVPSCEPVECPKPETVPHAIIRGDGKRFGQRISYECEEGYQMAGSSVRVCMEDQKWEPRPPECRPISCGRPPEGENMVVSYTSLVYQGVINYTCSEGFRLEGLSYRTCQSNGRWSGEDPSCEVIRCQNPESVAHAYLINSDSRYGSVVEYFCDEGYKLLGSTQRICRSDGKWDGTEPECVLVRCPLPSALPYGEIIALDTTYNSLAIYSCHKGYELRGPSHRTCLYDETWSGEDPYCIAIRCSRDELFLEHGRIIGDNNIIGSSIQYECNVGYRLVGMQTRTCQEDKTWNGDNPQCEIVQCPTPIAPTNAEVIWSGHSFGDSITYTCHEGYVLQGDRLRQCLPSGIWSGTEPVCLPVECEAPIAPQNGKVTYENAVFGEHAEFSCNAGYRLRGPRKRICKSDRSWSERQPTCQLILCPDPLPLINGRFLIKAYTVGEHAEYECDRGFRMIPIKEPLVCNSQGKWSGRLPVCKIVSCLPPPSLTFGYVEGTNFTFGNSLHFICNIGWKLIGESSVTCDETGNWSAPFPVCEGTLCPPPSHVEHGFVTSSNFTFGSTIAYQCHNGYEMIGIPQQRCLNDNTWSGESPICVPVVCNAPRNVSHATIVGDVYEYGSSVTYICDRGYELHGLHVLRCEETGLWSSEPPVCEQISCPLPRALENGEVLVESYSQGASGRALQVQPLSFQRGDITLDGKTVLEASRSNIFRLGDKVSYRCLSGYSLRGKSVRTCEENGLWSGDDPFCKPVSCKTPEKLAMGDVIFSSIVYKSKISYSCSTGYRIMGPTTRECQANASWSLELPMCTPVSCPPLQNIAHGHVRWSYLQYGSSATYECTLGYRTVGEPARICEQSGAWSGKEPLCVPVECGTPDAPENGWVEAEEIILGSTARYHCQDGYEIEGSPFSTCLANGSWSPEIPSCKIISCMPPPPLPHGHYNGSNFTYGSAVHYFCDQGYRLEGTSYLKCLSNKMWNKAVPTCAPLPCPRPVAPTHGTVLFRTLVVGSTVHFNCTDGYEIQGPDSSYCLPNQTWNTDPPQCTIISCPPVKKPKHGAVIGSNFTYNSMLSFDCDTKYRLDGPRSIVCLANKKWSKPAPKCRRYLCELPNIPNNSEVSLGPYVVGHVVQYTCLEGYILEGNNVLQCSSNGMWQGSVPRCNPVDCGKPPEMDHSTMQSDRGWLLGASVKYTCEFGYELRGHDSIVCNSNGNWTRAPVCEEQTCGPPPPLDHASVNVMKNPGVAEATYTCHSGYKFLGSHKHKCYGNGSWNISGTSCELVTCSDPPSIAFGSVSSVPNNTVGSRRNYACFPGYRIVGSSTVECSWQGLWEGRPPHCVPVTCPPPVTLPHGLVKGDDFSYQSSIHYSCHRGYQLYGRDTTFCLENGEWSGDIPICRKISCGELNPPENGYIVQDVSGLFGDKVRFACHNGFVLVGANISRCLDTGKWEKPAPKCTAPTCPVPTIQPPNTLSVAFNNAVFVAGDKTAFKCEPGFQATGDLSIECLSNGSWSVSSGSCKRMSCGRPWTNNGAIVLGMSYRYRDHLVVLCPPGSKAKGKTILTCQSNGQWDGKPTCEGMCRHPCLNGGVCIPPGLCSCPSGYVGNVCQHAVCILPCLNGGTCIGPYECLCKEGFTGSRCQIEIGSVSGLLNS